MLRSYRQAFQSFVHVPQFDKLGYFPQIDGLRALAVIAVFVEHFMKGSPLASFHWGRIGVIHFFVISGLLITMILLKYRNRAEAEQVGKASILRNFYIRRFIRIFPIYYLTIAVLFLAGYRPLQEHIGWLLTYTVNIGQGLYHIFFANLSHFWSLAVEEQFYIFFPLLVLFVRRKQLHWLLLMLIASSIGFKFIGTVEDLGWNATSRLLFGNLDSLCLGALYAYYLVYQDKHKLAFKRFMVICTFVGIPLLVGSQIFAHYKGLEPAKINLYYASFTDLGISMTSIVLLHMAVKNSSWLPGRVLTLPPIRYLGKISYGAYVYHFILRELPLPDLALEERFLLLSLLSFGIASLSWQILEEPINNLKRYFPYLKKGNLDQQQKKVVAPSSGP